MISILMSTYNNGKTLHFAIDSILKQTFCDFELIICDDASEDCSWDILCDACREDTRVWIFRNSHNLGLGASLNKCFGLAKGSYIARQDADDISSPERLEKTLEYLQKTEAPYVGCGVCVFDENGVWSHRIYGERISKHIIAQKNPFFHPTMLFRREVFEASNGYRMVPETRRTEDYDLVMRLAGMGIIGRNLQEYLYYVYEPKEAYFKHTIFTRWCEVKVRFYGLRQMHSPLRDYLYLLKPIIMCMIPRGVLRQVKCVQWSKRNDITVK